MKQKPISFKIHILTFGCSLNISDSEVMAGLLVKAGFKLVDSVDDADLVIVNSCTVKDKTEKNFWRLLKLLESKKKKIVVTGCIAQTDPEKLTSYSLVGTTQLCNIVDAVKQTINKKNVKYIKRSKTTPRLNLPKVRKNPVVEIIPISQGCLGSCTYCKTKAARFDLVSYRIDEILCQAKEAINSGVKEIWLTSQDNAVYGLDKGITLVDLLKELVKLNGDFKIRVGIGNPNHLSKIIGKLLPLFKSEKLFRFLHIPVQSGNNKILNAMNRKYSVEDFTKLIKKIRTAYSDMTLSTDIIIGFPGETEQQFMDSVNLVKKIKPDVLNMSKYSARPKTLAARMPQIHGRIIKQRSTLLAKEFYGIAVQQHRRWLGWKGNIIIDEVGKEGTDTFVGRNYAYKPVIVKKKLGEKKGSKQKKQVKLGDIIKVKITETTRNDLRGLVC